MVRPSHKRLGLGLLSAVTNKGELRWGDGSAVLLSDRSPSAMVLDGAIKAAILVRFLQHLVRDAGCRVFLVLDNLPVHRARLMQDWLAEHRAEIEVFYLPPYSPELNPDEGLNADLKQAATRKPPARSKDELRRRLTSHMRSLSKRPGRVRSFFGHHTYRYAA